MIMIEVRLFATFREGREKIQYLDPNQYQIAGQVLEYLNIPQEEVAIYLINGRHSLFSDSIKDGDILAIFPPVGGG
jgi:molybdopterin converting factor small subunit